MTDDTAEDIKKKNQRIIQMNKVVCICKGIPLKRILPALNGSETVADVNRKCGSGSGGCKGERCGPRIKKLLEIKRKSMKKDSNNKNDNRDDQTDSND